MRWLILFVSFAASVPAASAKDVMIILNDDDQQAFRTVLDQATRYGGIQSAPLTLYLLNKLNGAMTVVGEHVGSGEHKAEPPKPDTQDKPQ